MGRKLDALLEQSRGPYSVGGKSVRVTPAFRSLHKNSANHPPETYQLKIKSAVGSSQNGELGPTASIPHQ